jgi:hypothetical protein
MIGLIGRAAWLADAAEREVELSVGPRRDAKFELTD